MLFVPTPSTSSGRLLPALPAALCTRAHRLALLRRLCCLRRFAGRLAKRLATGLGAGRFAEGLAGTAGRQRCDLSLRRLLLCIPLRLYEPGIRRATSSCLRPRQWPPLLARWRRRLPRPVRMHATMLPVRPPLLMGRRLLLLLRWRMLLRTVWPLWLLLQWPAALLACRCANMELCTG